MAYLPIAMVELENTALENLIRILSKIAGQFDGRQDRRAAWEFFSILAGELNTELVTRELMGAGQESIILEMPQIYGMGMAELMVTYDYFKAFSKDFEKADPAVAKFAGSVAAVLNPVNRVK